MKTRQLQNLKIDDELMDIGRNARKLQDAADDFMSEAQYAEEQFPAIVTDRDDPDFDKSMPEDVRQWIIGHYEREDAKTDQLYDKYRLAQMDADEAWDELIPRFKRSHGTTLKAAGLTGWELRREISRRLEEVDSNV